MLQLRNETGFAGTVFASPNPDGIDTLYAVIKGTFDIAGACVPAEKQLPIVMADQHYGDPAVTSIRLPSDISLIKPRSDVLLLGQAYAPGGQAGYYTDVSLAVGPLLKVVRVFGDRVWQSAGPGTYVPSSPQPFVSLPLVWERAFGGLDQGKRGITGEARNPVGLGFCSQDSSRPIEGRRLPNLEDPAEPVSSWKQTPGPACFAPVSAHWQPRCSHAGTYDEAWQTGRAPYLPSDFDPRFFQLAPPGLVHPAGYLQGGELVDVRGATPNGWLRFQLPSVRVQITYVVGGSKEPRPTTLDTVIVEPDANRVVLIWRAALQCDKRILKVERVVAELAANKRVM
jgi:hypothetical protein